ncbi:MFS transporter [Tunicatimonas pelagia]|uniref:MFS transporter n=1 Tax=Tunicatimonas pelagia TaxID=931531 RepID=UPI00266517D4|nr:MFS transporter [Tunicatimonas pelagia]WKN42776.1 MFS transporter [Tunicatimonas pelagia]
MKNNLIIQQPIKAYYRWELILWLWLAFFLNQGDRQIYNTVIPLIKPDLNLTDVQIGLVATIFLLVYGLLVPFAGYAGDLFQRKWIVFTSLLVFSIGTLFTGTASTFVFLVIYRSVATGAGEAFYYPAANTLIAQHHQRTRAMAISIHQTANYVGVVASGFLAGYIGEQFGWRSSFYAFGAAGVVVAAIIALRVKSDKITEQGVSRDQITIREAIQYTLAKKTLILLSSAFGLMVFALLGYLTWMPTFLHEKFGLPLAEAGFSSMFYHHLLAFVGVLLGGRWSDHIAKQRKKFRVEIKMMGMLLGAPFIFMMGSVSDLWWCYLGLAGYGLFRGMYDSNLFAALYEVIEPKYRSSATGIMISFAFIVGALAPVALGWIKQQAGLELAIQCLAIAQIIAGILLALATRYTFSKDQISE